MIVSGHVRGGGPNRVLLACMSIYKSAEDGVDSLPVGMKVRASVAPCPRPPCGTFAA